ncbi:MAG: RNA methyltransferase [Sandaracinaceae bacterium]|nr:RNA methyltransferase [Sandaracinaceae bacterium]
MASVYSALIHYPVRDREGTIVTSAVTNVDVHDLARSSRTYGLAGYYVVTPIAAQRVLVGRILDHWRNGAGARRTPERGVALSICEAVASIDAACAAITEREGKEPRLIATSARSEGRPIVTYEQERATLATTDLPTLIVFGTGHGLHESVIKRASVVLAPIRPTGYNHLSVRAATAITLDRLFGDGPSD